MSSENENPKPTPPPAPTPAERPTRPVFPPDRIETHSEPDNRPNRIPPTPTPTPEKK